MTTHTNISWQHRIKRLASMCISMAIFTFSANSLAFDFDNLSTINNPDEITVAETALSKFNSALWLLRKQMGYGHFDLPLEFFSGNRESHEAILAHLGDKVLTDSTRHQLWPQLAKINRELRYLRFYPKDRYPAYLVQFWKDAYTKVDKDLIIASSNHSNRSDKKQSVDHASRVADTKTAQRLIRSGLKLLNDISPVDHPELHRELSDYGRALHNTIAKPSVEPNRSPKARNNNGIRGRVDAIKHLFRAQ